LYDDEELRRRILGEALPNFLVKKLGLSTIIDRVPDGYLRAIFGSYLASRFIYKCGPSASPLAFYSFMTTLSVGIHNKGSNLIEAVEKIDISKD